MGAAVPAWPSRPTGFCQIPVTPSSYPREDRLSGDHQRKKEQEINAQCSTSTSQSCVTVTYEDGTVEIVPADGHRGDGICARWGCSNRVAGLNAQRKFCSSPECEKRRSRDRMRTSRNRRASSGHESLSAEDHRRLDAEESYGGKILATLPWQLDLRPEHKKHPLAVRQLDEAATLLLKGQWDKCIVFLSERFPVWRGEFVHRSAGYTTAAARSPVSSKPRSQHFTRSTTRLERRRRDASSGRRTSHDRDADRQHVLDGHYARTSVAPHSTCEQARLPGGP